MKSCFKSKTFTTKILIVTVDYTCCNDKALACLKAHIKRLVKRKMKYSRNNSKIKKKILITNTCKPLEPILQKSLVTLKTDTMSIFPISLAILLLYQKYTGQYSKSSSMIKKSSSYTLNTCQKLVTNLKENVNIFNDFSSEQRQPFSNNSTPFNSNI